MLGIYLFAAIIGGGLLLFSLLGGSDHDASHADASGLDAGHDFDTGHDFDHDVGHDHDVSHDVHGGAGELLLGLFRPRNLIFFLAAFGLTGTLLTLITPASEAGSLLPSLVMGFIAMLLTHSVFVWLKRSDTAVDAVSDTELEGCIGRVVLPLTAGERGRIACLVGGREVHLVARLAEDSGESLAAGSEVVVLRVSDTVAEVIPFESRELPPPES